MKEFKRVLSISLYMMGLILILSSCAKEKTYYSDEPNSPSSNNKVDICRIGNKVIRLSVLTSFYSDGELFLSSTTDFSSTPYQTVKENVSWSSSSNEKQNMYPFYLQPELDKKYYYYVACYSDKIASGSFIMKDVADILKVKQLTSLSDGMELTLSVPVWFLNIVRVTSLYVFNKGQNSSTNSSLDWCYGSSDKVNHEIKYIINSRYLDTATEYNYELYFMTEENSTSYWDYCDFRTTTGTGRFTTAPN